MNNLGIKYEIKHKDSDLLARTANVKINGKKFSTPFLWFGLSTYEKAEFQYNVFSHNRVEGIIANAYYLMFKDKKLEKRRLIRNLNKENKSLIKCDSGGFQNLTSNKQLKQDDVYLIQKEIKADIAIQLDYPLLPEASEITNYRRIDKTIANFAKLYSKNDNMSILPTIHGHNINMIKYSITKLTDILGEIPSAVAIGSLVPFLFSMKGTGEIGGKKKALELLKSVREYLPETFLHVLGAGGTMTYLLLLLGIDSFDNTGWIKKAGYGAIQMPGISDRFIFKTAKRKSLDDDNFAMKSWLECVCPACSNTSNRSDFFGTSKESRFLRSIHNVYVYQTEIWRARKYINENRIEDFLSERLQNSIYKKLYNHIKNQIQLK